MLDYKTYKTKSNELKAETTQVDESVGQLGDVDTVRGDLTVRLFDWTQKAAEVWSGSNSTHRRVILNAVCLNRVLSDINLVLE